ncbi:MAG: NAD(P)H-binding protein [Candidatus Marinimicrobia bacterium]|nr:NAD(P)H-binding protein [Candidatus Neomarinimicrobiota bacterium]
MSAMSVIMIGGSGEVGGAVVREMIKSDVCSQLTLIGRRSLPDLDGESKVKQIVVDMSDDDFEELVKDKAKGYDVAVSCLGIGSGTYGMSEEQMMAIEVDLIGAFARGCKAAGIEIFELLTAVGIKESWTESNIKGFRVMGKKLKTVIDTGFEKLAVFKPGMIVGNAHTPSWIAFFTGLLPDSAGLSNIHQKELAIAFVTHLEKRVESQREAVVSYGNKEMKELSCCAS